MPLAVGVALTVLVVVFLVGVAGYLIDKSAGREERKWER